MNNHDIMLAHVQWRPIRRKVTQYKFIHDKTCRLLTFFHVSYAGPLGLVGRVIKLQKVKEAVALVHLYPWGNLYPFFKKQQGI